MSIIQSSLRMSSARAFDSLSGSVLELVSSAPGPHEESLYKQILLCNNTALQKMVWRAGPKVFESSD